MMFIATLFIAAKKWKSPEYSPTDEWVIKCGILFRHKKMKY